MPKVERETALAGVGFDFSGIRAAEAARSVGRSSGWISQLTARYNLDGAAAVADRRDDSRKTGRVPTVRAELAVKLEAALQNNAPDGGVWTAKKVALWIERQTGRKLHETSAWRVLRGLGFTVQTVRPAHQRSAAPEEQSEFKKTNRARRQVGSGKSRLCGRGVG